jgi:hypothetical protein
MQCVQQRKLSAIFFAPDIVQAANDLIEDTLGTTDHRKPSGQSMEEDMIRSTGGKYFNNPRPALFDANAFHKAEPPMAGSYANASGTQTDRLSPNIVPDLCDNVDQIDPNNIGNSLSSEERNLLMHVSFIPRTNPSNRREMLASQYREEFLAAEQKELTSIASNRTLSKLMPIPPGARVVGNRFV